MGGDPGCGRRAQAVRELQKSVPLMLFLTGDDGGGPVPP